MTQNSFELLTEYQIPSWSGVPENTDILFEIIKDGAIIDQYKIVKK